MPLNQYARMRLLWGYTDKFRSDNQYIFFLYDWIRKKRIYNDNNAVNFYKLNEINKELLIDSLEYTTSEDFNYYDKLGTRLFASIKHSQEYKAQRFYEIQSLIHKFGKPDLFVTIRFEINDDDITNYIKKIFGVKWDESINFNNYPIEYSHFFKKKVLFVRSLFKPEKEKYTIFGKVEAYADTLEYTKSGVPHLHFLIWLHEDSKHMASIDGNMLVFARKK